MHYPKLAYFAEKQARMTDLKEYLDSKEDLSRALLVMERPTELYTDQMYDLIKFVLLVYSSDSPLMKLQQYSLLSKRISYCESFLDVDTKEEKSATLVMLILDDFLCHHQFVYEYEHLVTCHIQFMDNTKELRKPIVFILEEDKRLKASEIKGKLRAENKLLMADIQEYTKLIYGSNEDLLKGSTKNIRLNVEAMIGK